MRIAPHSLLAGAIAVLCLPSLAFADGSAAVTSVPVQPALTSAPAGAATTALPSGAGPASVAPPVVAPPALLVVPAKTPLTVHLTAPISSNGSKSGSTFTFVTVDPVVVNGRTVVAAGATGTGTLILAGHAGYNGHEGDLTLRFDSVPTVDGQVLQFDDQRIEINGRNRKVVSFLAGFVPYVGLAAGFIRGSEMSIAPTTIIHTLTKKDASTGSVQAKT
jgi:hypothetical protein